jgi:hypothetical protein
VRILFVSVLCAFILFACAEKDAPEKASLNPVTAKQELFLLGGKPIAPRPSPGKFKSLDEVAFESADATTAAYTPVRNIVFSNWDCDAAWDQRCESEQTIEAWSGWQVCQAVYRVIQQGGHDAWISVSPTNWYVGDAESPDRYRAVRLQIHAFGNSNPFDRRGSRMWVGDIGITMIPAEASNFDRYRSGCSMPPHD